MKSGPKPPKAYEAFLKRYPEIGEAWDRLGEAGGKGPLDPKSARLVKLAASIGALREGAVRAGARKALSEGVTRAEVEQVIALAVSTIGFPASVAVFTWIEDILNRGKRK
jgi:alkylhydroperoxidase/carboxymuconolactone decarboxylase family protein YurZ